MSGARSIGGNLNRLEDGDRALVFDRGLGFSVMGRFYRGFVTPKGLRELGEMNTDPKAERYKGTNAIYISHIYIAPRPLSSTPSRVYLPTCVYEVLEERWVARRRGSQ